MRTQEEIVAKVEEIRVEGWDFFGTATSDLLEFVEFKNAKKFLREEAEEKDWIVPVEPTPEVIKAKIVDYLPFAWEKANNCRGLSAGRSLTHMYAWLWLMGDDVLESIGDVLEYEFYGKDHLVNISKLVGFDWEAYDDGERSNTEY